MSKRALIKAPIAPYMVRPVFHTELDDEGWYGQTIEILEKLDDGWYKIKTPYKYETFVHEQYLCLDSAEVERYNNADLRCVYQNTADVLDSDDYQGANIITLVKGAVIEYAEAPKKPLGWVKIRLIGGKYGYIKEKRFGTYHRQQNGNEMEFRANVVRTALEYLGTQYRWGGKTPMGIDCSGLCGTAYLLNGVKIYRNANIVEGFPIHEIPLEAVREGDLLFFKGHVAMYIGRGKFIHSTGHPGSDGVVINSLIPSEPDYREDLMKIYLKAGSIF